MIANQLQAVKKFNITTVDVRPTGLSPGWVILCLGSQFCNHFPTDLNTYSIYVYMCAIYFQPIWPFSVPDLHDRISSTPPYPDVQLIKWQEKQERWCPENLVVKWGLQSSQSIENLYSSGFATKNGPDIRSWTWSGLMDASGSNREVSQRHTPLSLVACHGTGLGMSPLNITKEGWLPSF